MPVLPEALCAAPSIGRSGKVSDPLHVLGLLRSRASSQGRTARANTSRNPRRRFPRGGLSRAISSSPRRSRVSTRLPWLVDIGPVFNGQDSDLPDAVIDAIDHPVVTAPCAVQPAEAEPERVAGPLRICSQGAVQELRRCGRRIPGSRASARRAGAAQAIATLSCAARAGRP
jgi:hypothetical protein